MMPSLHRLWNEGRAATLHARVATIGYLNPTGQCRCQSARPEADDATVAGEEGLACRAITPQPSRVGLHPGSTLTHASSTPARPSLPLAGLLAVFLLACSSISAPAAPRSPLVIDGTSQLRSLAVTGDGSAARPYLIEGLHIDAAGAPYCLTIRNVASHFVVRNSRFQGATEAAVVLVNVRNGWFIDNIFNNNMCAVVAAGLTRDVYFAGNSFMCNVWDAHLDESSGVAWSDSIIGNYWDHARGLDVNGDRILDNPYVLQLKGTDRPLAKDPHPLAEPVVGGPLEPGRFLLHASYDVGNTIELVVTFRSEITSLFLFAPAAITISATQVLHQRVLSAPGTGFFTVQETVVEDIGETTVNGHRQTYESTKGRNTVRKIHRLGVMISPGYGIPDIQLAAVEPSPDFPAAPVSMGHMWGTTQALDPATLGMDSGDYIITTSFELRGVELLDGDFCATINGELRSTAQGLTANPIFGELEYSANLVIQVTVSFSLSRHRVVQQQLDTRFESALSAQGIPLQRQQGRIVTTVRERASSGESGVGNRPTPTQLEELAHLLSRGDYATVAEAGRQLAALFEAAGLPEWQAVALWLTATALERLNRFREAIEIWEQALPVYATLQNPHDEAAVLNNLGICYRRTGEHWQALRCYERALNLAESDPELRSTVLVNSGSCLVAMGQYTQALRRFREARELRRGRDVPGEINVLNFMGLCSRKLGQYDTAVQFYDEALQLCGPEVPPVFRLVVMQNKAAALQERGEPEEALALLIVVRDHWSELSNPDGEAAAWVMIGRCQLSMGRPEPAISSLERAARLTQRSDILASAEYHKGLGYLDVGLSEAAIQALMEARSWMEQGGDLEGLWRADWALARAFWQIGKLPAARERFQKALESIEGARKHVEEEEHRRAYMGHTHDLYREYLDFLWHTGEGEILLWHAETARARTLLDILSLGGVPYGTSAQSLALALEPSTLDGVRRLSELSRHFLVERESILVYALGQRRLYCWVISSSGGEQTSLRPIVGDFSYDELLWRVYEVRALLEAPSGGTFRVLDLQDKLHELYQLLIAPVEGELQGKDTLIIVPAGPLWYVPFPALVDGDGRYLLERYTLAYAPSVASIPLLLRAAAEGASSGAVGFANPVRPDMTSLVRMEPAVETLVHALGGNRLYVRGEATERRVRQELGVRGGGEEKEKEGKRGGYSYVVFGCHGVFNHVNPMYSFLALAGEGDKDGDLYAVETLDLNLKGTKLVMLLACETFLPAIESRAGAQTAGLGGQMTVEEKVRVMRDLARGDEIVGLTRAFLLAGAEAVLATHWEVAEEAGRLFAYELGRCLAAGLGRAEAIRAAQLALLRRLPDPWFWAPFILVGNWR